MKKIILIAILLGSIPFLNNCSNCNTCSGTCASDCGGCGGCGGSWY